MTSKTWAIGGVTDGAVKAKRNRTGNIPKSKAGVRRVVERKPEAMVKVSGGVGGARHLKAHMDYVTRNGKLEAENERGETIRGTDELREHWKEWADDLGKARKNERDTINMVLSMPSGTNAEAVKRAAREFAKDEFGNTNKYMMALHTDTKHPHVHLTVKSLGYDGSRLNPRKDDLQHWREVFAQKLRAQGVEAEATPRAVRGVVTKGKRQDVYHLEKTGASTVQAAKMREAASELAGKPGKPNPAREAITQKQTSIRREFTNLADSLSKSPDKDDKDLAEKIRAYVKDMPKQLKDEREKMKEAILKEYQERQAQKAKTQEQEPQKKKPEQDRGPER